MVGIISEFMCQWWHAWLQDVVFSHEYLQVNDDKKMPVLIRIWTDVLMI